MVVSFGVSMLFVLVLVLACVCHFTFIFKYFFFLVFVVHTVTNNWMKLVSIIIHYYYILLYIHWSLKGWTHVIVNTHVLFNETDMDSATGPWKCSLLKESEKSGWPLLQLQLHWLILEFSNVCSTVHTESKFLLHLFVIPPNLGDITNWFTVGAFRLKATLQIEEQLDALLYWPGPKAGAK